MRNLEIATLGTTFARLMALTRMWLARIDGRAAPLPALSCNFILQFRSAASKKDQWIILRAASSPR